MRHFTQIILCLFCFTQIGCTMFTRTVYVPDGASVRLRQTIRNAKIWAKQKDESVVEGRMNIPEGWFCFYNPDWQEVKK